MGSILISGAFIPVILISILILSVLCFIQSPWFKGFIGEMMVHLSAKIHLNKDKYHVLRNVTLPTADGITQIDHIIVSQYGVFVIETKNMKGWIFGGAHQKMWTQKIFTYTKKFQNPLHQNYKHVETLKSLLELTDQQIFSVVVFVGSSSFKTEMPNNVISGPRLTRYIKSKERPVILGSDVPMMLSKIEAERLVPTRETTKAPISRVKTIIEEKKTRHSCTESKSPEAVRGQPFPDDSRAPKSGAVLGAAAKTDEVAFLNEEGSLFTDSWGNRTWRDDEIEPAFIMDRVFR